MLHKTPNTVLYTAAPAQDSAEKGGETKSLSTVFSVQTATFTKLRKIGWICHTYLISALNYNPPSVFCDGRTLHAYLRRDHRANDDDDEGGRLESAALARSQTRGSKVACATTDAGFVYAFGVVHRPRLSKESFLL